MIVSYCVGLNSEEKILDFKEDNKLNKTKSITFRVTEHDKKSITSRAKTAKMKTSDFCRNAALSKEIRSIEGLDKVSYQLSKIGGNINQIAKKCNQRQIVNPDLKDIQCKLGIMLDTILAIQGEINNGDS